MRDVVRAVAAAVAICTAVACGPQSGPTDLSSDSGVPSFAKGKGGGGGTTEPSGGNAPTDVPPPGPQILLDFEEIEATTGGVPMPAGFGGLAWGDRWWTMLSVATGNHHLALSSCCSLTIRRADGGAFYFDGADFWSRRAADAVGDFYYVFSYQGRVVYNGLNERDGRNVFDGSPTFFPPAYVGAIDAIGITFDGNGKDWNHLAMDNLRFRLPE